MLNDEYELSLEQVAATLAHEVKNPLSLVKANIDILEQNDAEERNSRSYKIMRRELDKINELLLDFIQFAKPAGEGLSRLRLRELLEGLLEPLKISYRGKIEFSLSAIEENIEVKADENKLKRVFGNMFKNAVEAIEALAPEARERRAGGEYGFIEVTLDKKEGAAEITIEDNGRGMTAEEAAQASRPFFTTKRGGSGLGVYLSKSIVSEYGGELLINGREEGGCKVTVMLPHAAEK